jgi:hypothetical protein
VGYLAVDFEMLLNGWVSLEASKIPCSVSDHQTILSLVRLVVPFSLLVYSFSYSSPVV